MLEDCIATCQKAPDLSADIRIVKILIFFDGFENHAGFNRLQHCILYSYKLIAAPVGHYE